MGDERRDSRLDAEALERPGPHHRLRSKQADGDFAVEAQVARAVDLALAVAADPCDQLVVGHPLGARPAAADGHGAEAAARAAEGGSRSCSRRASASGQKPRSADCHIVKSAW